MKIPVTISLIVLIFFMGYRQQQKVKLHCIVKGIEERTGTVEVALYNNEESFPIDGEEYLSKSLPVKKDTLAFTFCLTPGDYAIALYHDRNGNGRCDKNRLGIPRERFGFSNNIHPRLRAPSFRKATIHLEADTTIVIRLIKY